MVCLLDIRLAASVAGVRSQCRFPLSLTYTTRPEGSSASGGELYVAALKLGIKRESGGLSQQGSAANKDGQQQLCAKAWTAVRECRNPASVCVWNLHLVCGWAACLVKSVKFGCAVFWNPYQISADLHKAQNSSETTRYFYTLTQISSPSLARTRLAVTNLTQILGNCVQDRPFQKTTVLANWLDKQTITTGIYHKLTLTNQINAVHKRKHRKSLKIFES